MSLDRVEQLVPSLIEAGMDLHRIKTLFGDQIALMGGLDVRILEENDLEKLHSYLEKMLPEAIKGSGYILHTDHSIPQNVSYETYKSFLGKGLEIGTYDRSS